MANPLIHSKSSVRSWGGHLSEYLPLHELIASPKVTMNNNPVRLLTHNTWFAYHIMPKIFGYNITNSDGKSVDVVDIAMLHIAEDFRFKGIPTPQDYLQHLQVQPWMNNGVKDIPSEESKQNLIEFQKRLKEIEIPVQ